MKDVVAHIGSVPAIQEFTAEQRELIKSTVAKGATDNELKLFLYRCQNMGLDPLKPGMVHFVKYGSNPGTMIVGIDGFRAKAARTGKMVGIKRGVIREDGRCIGAWCEVYRSDWIHPAREEVSLAEYNTGKSQWAKMPETMIKKVAEAAALRMAFPDDLGGVYAEEEMDQARPREASPKKADEVNQLLNQAPALEIEPIDCAPEPELRPNLGDYVIPIGNKYKGKRLADVDRGTLRGFIEWVVVNIENKTTSTLEFIETAEKYLKETSA